MTIGGNVGSRPRIGNELIGSLSGEQALENIEKVINYYREYAGKGERLGKMIDRVGLDPFMDLVV
jgi:dissimilatory sulfite reductase (desulfoviridin) alpha/beta subunit